jgi:hypothetical protein
MHQILIQMISLKRFFSNVVMFIYRGVLPNKFPSIHHFHSQPEMNALPTIWLMTSHYNRYKFTIPWWIPGRHAAPAPSSPGSAGCASAVDERREDELLCAVAAWWRFWLGRTHEVWVQWMGTYWILMGYSWDMGGYGILRSWYRWLGCLVYGDEVTV